MAPHAVGYLAGINDAASVQPFLERLPPFPLAEMVYTQLIQSGSPRIHLARGKYTILGTDSFLRERIVLYESIDELAKMQRINATIKAIANPTIHQDDTRFTKIVYFIADVLLALQTNAVPVMVTTVPTEDDVFAVLQPKAAVAVAGLVTAVSKDSTSVALPRIVVGKREARLFDEVLQSNLFTPYSHSHESLINESNQKSRVILDLRKNAVALQRHFSDRLELKQTLIPMFRVTSKLVDTVFGKLPGALAEMFATAGEHLIEERSRVVLVHAGPAIRGLFERRMQQMFDSIRKNAS